MKKLFFAMPNDRFNKIFPSPVLEDLKTRYEIIDVEVPVKADEIFVKAHIRDAEIVVTSWTSPMITADILEHAKNIEIIAHAAGSVKPIVSEAVWNRGLAVSSAAKAIADGVAEYCIGLTLTASKRVFWYSDQVRNGYWPKGNDVFGPPFEIYRQNIGIIGAGYVGRKFIELLKPFCCNVLLFDPYVTSESASEMGVEKIDSLDDLFAQCKVVSLHAPTTDETKGMIRGSHFAKLPHGALFINTARGIIIRQSELIDELRKGRFIACLDVTDPEPPAIDDPLRTLPNVILTPHKAGTISENLRRIGEFVLSEIDAFYAGKPMIGGVTKKKLEVMA